MAQPFNQIPLKITQLPEDPAPSNTGWMMYVNNGVTYKVQVNAVLSVSGVPTSRAIIAGAGLAGGGTLATDVTIYVAPGGIGATQLNNTGVTPGVYGDSDEYPILTVDSNGRITAMSTYPVPSTNNFVPTSREVIAGVGLLGGGALTSNVTLSAALSNSLPLAVGTTSAGVSTSISRSDHVHPAIDLTDTLQTDGVLDPTRGGTGTALTAPAAGGVAYSDGFGILVSGAGTAGQVLVSDGPNPPYFASVGAGSVTSVGLTMPSGFSVANSPVTSSGTLAVTTSLSGILKGTGSGFTTATSGTDYAPATSGTSILYGNGTGGFSNVTVGSGLSFSTGTLSATGSGTVTSVTATAPIASSGGTTPDISISQASGSANGYLSSTDWTTFNSKGNGTVTSVAATAGTGISITGSPITTSGTFNITNTAPDQVVSLTAGSNVTITGTYPSFTIASTGGGGGGVTSVTATAPVASSGGSTPDISMAAATTSVSGYLTSTDWNTFNSKGNGTVTSVTATSPVTSTGGATPVIAMPAATTSVSGYLTSTDWTTFNGKAPATSGTSILYGNGSGGFSNVTIGTNLTFSGGTLDATGGGGGMTYPSGTGIAVVTSGTSWGTTLTAPTGDVVGTSDTQTLTNKTLGNTNVITARSDRFTLQDATNTAKIAKFDLSGLTATTYNYTLPTVNGAALATLGAISQTFAGGTTFSNTLTGSGDLALTGSTGTTTQLGTSATSGTITIGGTGGSGAITVGQSISSQTLNLGTGVTTSGLTNTINIGSAGASGSTTNITLGSTTGTSVTARGTWTFSGASTFSGSLTGSSTLALTGGTNTTTQLGTSATSGTLTVGSTSGVGTLILGQSTVSQTTNIQANTTSTGNTKTINIGTAGASGSTTTIAIGSSVSGATSTTALNGVTTVVGFTETVFTITDAAGFEIDPSNGSIQTITLGASRTPAATNFTAGESVTLMINDGTAYTITWTTVGVVWVGGVAPTLATTGFTVIELWKVGTTIYGAYVGAA
jgi:fibronectin-binding autotransporter adhesin